jgi:CHAT domain-containing protein/tetratricopeptide (TPR) repeat protein
MNDAQDNEKLFYRFLLGEALPDEQERIEIRLLEDAELQGVIQSAEFDLIDDYIRGDLSAEEVRSFEQAFLNSTARRHTLEMARVLLKSNAQITEESPSSEVINLAQHASREHSRKKPAWRMAARIAAGILLLVGIGVVGWRVLLPWWQVRQGLAMLNEAYSQGRPIESRLSGFQYTSWEKDRSGNERPVDYTARDQASLMLLGVARRRPSAKAYQALGSSYLLKREIEEAIDQFNRALAYDPSNAAIHNDLGAALMEFAMNKRQRVDQLRETPSQLSEQLSIEILSDLSLANEHFSQALQKESRSAEALFNQSLCLERLGLIDQAIDSWERYLRLDPQSGWAGEARAKLDALKKQKDKTFFDRDRIFRNFLDAYDSGDEERIRRSFILGSQQRGNLITELLLDQYLELRSQGRQAEAQNRLDILTTAGRIESSSSGDLYTRDLAAFYRATGPEQAMLLSSARRVFGEAYEKNKKSMPEAGALYQQARRMFARAGSRCEVALADLMIGSYYVRASEYQSAGKIAEALARDSRVRSYLWLLARSQYLISDLNTSQNRPARGIEYSKLALSIAERKQDWNEKIGILGQLASAHRFLGAHEESMHYARQALDLARFYPVAPTILWLIYRVSADALNAFSRLFTSAAFEKQALLLAIEMKRPLLISRSYGFLSEIYGKLKNYQEAIELAGKDLKIGHEYGDIQAGLDIQAHALLRLGHLYREVGSLAEALNAFNDCIRISESGGLLYERLDAHRGRLMVYAAKRDYSSARAELEKALEIFELNRRKIDDNQLSISFLETGRDIYDLGIELSLTLQKDYRQAFRYAEQGRARSLLDLMTPLGGLPLKSVDEASANQPLTLSQITDQIPASAQIIQYSSLRDSLHIWALSSSGFLGTTQNIGSDELSRKVNEYLDCIKDPKLNGQEEILARELYAILITPIEKRLDPGREIFIVPDRPFNNLPFGALIDPETGKYLTEKYIISFAPSSTVFIRCSDLAKQKEEFFAERCLSIGQSVFKQSGLLNSALPSTRAEAEEVAARYGPRSKLLLDSAATEDFVRREIGNFEVIHIATHGLVNREKPEYSGLALWEKSDTSTPDNDGALQAGEIIRMKLPRARLVVLSACQTMIGRDYHGEGMVGLARAFIASGAPVVISSLWNIDSRMTAKMMNDFHRYRTQSKMSAARAIRQAQLEMLRQDSLNYRRPYSWAGFVVVGGYAQF